MRKIAAPKKAKIPLCMQWNGEKGQYEKIPITDIKDDVWKLGGDSFRQVTLSKKDQLLLAARGNKGGLVFAEIGNFTNNTAKTLFEKGVAYEEVGFIPEIDTKKIGRFVPAYFSTVNTTKEEQEIFKAAFRQACNERKENNKKGGIFYS